MDNLSKAARTLKSGGVIAFPTETVFGIGACFDKPRAISRIFKIKQRPKNKPLQILAAKAWRESILLEAELKYPGLEIFMFGGHLEQKAGIFMF